MIEKDSPPPPSERPVGSAILLNPLQITFPMLIKISCVAIFNHHIQLNIKYCHNLVSSKKEKDKEGNVSSGWTAGTLETYLKSAGINDATIEQFYDFSAEHENQAINDQLMNKFMEHAIPPTWKCLGCKIAHQLDVVFHLVFHRVTIDVWESFLTYCAKSLKYSNTSIKTLLKIVFVRTLPAIHQTQIEDFLIVAFSEKKNEKTKN